jgi:uncharacterized protein (TIGR00290 family)
MSNLQPHKTYFNWSTGKDSSFALYKLQKDSSCCSVDLLLTTINAQFDRVSMHGVRRILLEAQAKAIGIPLRIIELPETPSMDEYEEIMRTQVERLQQEGYSRTGFGDIFLQDLRENRENKLKPYGISCEFPLWKLDTTELMHEFLRLGFRTIVVSTQAKYERFVGRVIDEALLQDLIDDTTIDPCGENGEFHTFCFDGPIFTEPVQFAIGEKVYREYKYNDQTYGYWFCDLLPPDGTVDKDPQMP